MCQSPTLLLKAKLGHTVGFSNGFLALFKIEMLYFVWQMGNTEEEGESESFGQRLTSHCEYFLQSVRTSLNLIRIELAKNTSRHTDSFVLDQLYFTVLLSTSLHKDYTLLHALALNVCIGHKLYGAELSNIDIGLFLLKKVADILQTKIYL